jgi:hypothetical protein
MVYRRLKGLLFAFLWFSLWVLGPVSTSASTVSLVWNAVPDMGISGYRLYQGALSGDYTNVVDVGNATNGAIANLPEGNTYYFAVTSYNDIGLESVYSQEVSYTPGLPLRPELHISLNNTNAVVLTGTGQPGYVYDILATQDFASWQPLTNVTLDANGAFSFTDNSASSTAQRFYQLRQVAQ